jgi:CDP-glucose 4,6-dehydratase
MSFWEGKRVVVTGGYGLIGTPMVRCLKSIGAEVLNMDLPQYDVTSYSECLAALEDQEICIHLAAVSHVENSRANPLTTYEVNVRGTWNILEAARQQELGAVIIPSSNHVYGPQVQYPVKETAELNQMDTYSVGKICVDYIARSYAHNYQSPVGIIRNTNCFGPNDPHSSHIVPSTILAMLAGSLPTLQSLGTVKKGYLYVDDVVDAMLLVAQGLMNGVVPFGSVYNVGAPPINAFDLASLIMGIMGMPNQDPIILGKKNDQASEQMDSTKIQALGWEPKWSLTEGLEATIQWFRQNAKVAV